MEGCHAAAFARRFEHPIAAPQVVNEGARSQQTKILHAIAKNGFLRKQFETALARNVGFAGRALLTPLG